MDREPSGLQSIGPQRVGLTTIRTAWWPETQMQTILFFNLHPVFIQGV